MPEMDTKTRKRLRQIAHHLDPIVSVGEHGLSDALVAEANRALADHELIKVKVQSPDRTERADISATLASRCEALVIQKIGKMVILFRANPDAKPALSNLSRFA